jgi:hypothetical protein
LIKEINGSGAQHRCRSVQEKKQTTFCAERFDQKQRALTKTGNDARSPGHVGYRHPGLHRLLDQPDLLGGRPTATPLD